LENSPSLAPLISTCTYLISQVGLNLLTPKWYATFFSQLGSSFEMNKKSERISTILSTLKEDTSKKYMSKNMGCNILAIG
jgi:hypothetical protein